MPRLVTTEEAIIHLCTVGIDPNDPTQRTAESFKKELDDAWNTSELEAIKVVREWAGGGIAINEIKQALRNIYKEERNEEK